MRQFDCLNSVFALKNERTPSEGCSSTDCKVKVRVVYLLEFLIDRSVPQQTFTTLGKVIAALLTFYKNVCAERLFGCLP